MYKQQLTWKDIVSSDVPLHDYIYYPNESAEYLAVLKELEVCKTMGFDIETYGLESWMALYPWKGKIRSFQIGLPSGKVIIIDLGGWDKQQSISTKERFDQLPSITQKTLNILETKLFSKDTTVLGANLIFDLTWLRVHLGWVVRSCRDIMLMSQVLWGGVGSEKKGTTSVCLLPHDFGSIAKRVGVDIKKGFGSSNWGWGLTNEQINYQAEDVKYLFPVFDKLKSLIIQEGCLYSAYVECQAVTAFAEMQYQGFPVDVELAESFVNDSQTEVNQLLEQWHLAFPNVPCTSNPQVLEALNSILPSSIDSVDKQVLNSLDTSSLESIYSDAIYALKKIRKLEVSKKYAQGIIDYAFDGGTGRNAIRTSFRQIGPSGSGRTTASSTVGKGQTVGVQLQNPGKDVRFLFRHSNPNKVMFTYDASGSHMRIAAQYAYDYWLETGHTEQEASEMLIIKLFRDDYDGHSVFGVDIANRLFGKNWTAEEFMRKLKEKNPDGTPTADAVIAAFCRKKGSKPGFYSCINGAGWNKNYSTLTSNGFTCTVEDAKYITSRLEYHHPGLLGFIKSRPNVINSTDVVFPFVDRNGKDMSTQHYGYVKSLTGRRQYFKKYKKTKYDKNRGGFVEGEYERDRQGEIITEVSFTNSISGHWLLVESDVMKDIVQRLQDQFYENPEWGAVIFNMVHDEFNGECNHEYKEVVGKAIQTTFRECFSKWVTAIPVLDDKFEADPCCGFMESWDEK
jgi:DNA polymerase I-like protein with 3'-5' exonuclease and polymerase domains